MENKYKFLEQFPIFEVLDTQEREQLFEMVNYKIRPKYSYLYMPDEISDKVFFLLKGTVKMGTHSGNGKEVIKAILHPYAMFGELGIVGENKRQDFARAMNEEVHFFVLKVADLKKLMRSNHKLSLRVLELVGNRLRRAETRLESLIFKDARTRIIDFLKLNARERGRKVGYEMVFRHSLTQQDIANITGTSRQTVTSVLNELRKDNLIYFNRKSVLIRDMARLV